MLHAAGPMSPLSFLTKLTAGVKNKVVWATCVRGAQMALDIRGRDRVPAALLFAEWGLQFPGIAALCQGAKLLDSLRVLPADAPARVALVADVIRTLAIPVEERVKPLPPAQATAGAFGMVEAAVSVFAGLEWGLRCLGLHDYLGGLGAADTHAPWEPQPPPLGVPGAVAASGPSQVRQAFAARRAELVGATWSGAHCYLPLVPDAEEAWQCRITSSAARHAFAAFRVGAVHLHEWEARYGRSLWCPSCSRPPGLQVPCTFTHVLTACPRTAALRRSLRAKLLALFAEAVDVVGTTAFGAIRDGISAQGVIPVAGRAAWSIFLRGGQAPPPAPFRGCLGARAAVCPKETRTALWSALFALPRFILKVRGVVDRILAEVAAAAGPTVTGGDPSPPHASGVVTAPLAP